MTAVSAHELTRTRICAQPGCPLDASPSSDLCPEHDEILLRKFSLASNQKTEADEIMEEIEDLLPSADRRTWTADSVIARIRAFASEHGRPPKTAELGANGLPSQTTVKRLFGNLGNAVVQAGFARPTRGGARRGKVVKVVAAVPPPAARPKTVSPPPRVEDSEPDGAPTLTPLAERVEALSTRRRAMLAELDQLERERAEAVAALRAALKAHELEDGL